MEFANDMAGFFGSDPLLSASIRITRECNLACPHCYVFSELEPHPSSSEFSLPELRRVVRAMADLGCRELFVTGGEPLLSPHVFDAVRFASKMGVNVSLSTNATKATAATLTALAEAGLARLQVSVDGPRARHDEIRGPGTFDAASAAVEYWIKTIGKPITVSFAFGIANATALPEMVDVIVDLGNPDFSITVIIEGGRAKSGTRTGRLSEGEALAMVLTEFFDRYRSQGMPFRFSRTGTLPIALVPEDVRTAHGDDHFLMCAYPYTLGLDPDGRVAPCDGLLGHEGLTFAPGGNGVVEAWRHPEFVRVRAIEPASLTGVCGVCRFRERCAGGCRAAAIIENGGDRYAPDPVCQSVWDAGVFPRAAIDPSAIYRPVGA